MNYCLWCFEEIITVIQWGNLFNINKQQVLCSTCSEQLEIITGNSCRICSRPQTINATCFDCVRWESFYGTHDPLVANHSLYIYNDFIQEIIIKWKYRGDYCLKEIFREKFYLAVRAFVKQEKIKPMIVPMPLSNQRLLERGFNQARALAELVEFPISDVIERVHSEKQSKMGRYERLDKANPFKINASIGGTVIIIDDIYTTGSTLRHAASLLKAAGASEIYSFTLIRS